MQKPRKSKKPKAVAKLKDLKPKKNPKRGTRGIWENHNETLIHDSGHQGSQ